MFIMWKYDTCVYRNDARYTWSFEKGLMLLTYDENMPRNGESTVGI